MSKSSVIWHLRASGVSLRPSNQVPEGKKQGLRNYHFGHAPFGYVHLDGQLVVDPREMAVVHQITGMWKAGMGSGEIMRKLNSSKIKTRHGNSWRYKTIISVIKRECPGKKLPSKEDRGK